MVPVWKFFHLTTCLVVSHNGFNMPKRNVKQYQSVAAYADDKHLKTVELARLLQVHPSQASKLRRGVKKYRSLIEPLRIAKVCNMPIENLAPKTAA